MSESKYRNENLSDPFPFKAYTMNGAVSLLSHWHEHVEILYCINDHFEVGIGSDFYRVEEGQCVIIGPCEKHFVFASDNMKKRIVILFHPDLVNLRDTTGEKKKWHKLVQPHSADWPEDVQNKVRDSVLTLLDENTDREVGWMEAVYAELYRIKSLYMRHIANEDKAVRIPTNNSALKRVLEYLGDNFNKGITLNDCAAELRYNRSYISALIKRNTGSSFHKYLTDIRLNEATQLLMDYNLNVAEVAERAGFTNTGTFHRVFYNRYAMPPGEYRKKYYSDPASESSRQPR